MRLRALLESVPEPYAVERGRRGILAAERSQLARLLGAGFGPDGGEQLSPSDLCGRSALGTIEVEGERWIVRRFRHGGLFRWLGERFFLAPARPFQELLLSTRLASAGIGTPRVVAARAVRGRIGWRLALVTARLEDAVDGGELLERMRRGELDPGLRREVFNRAGEIVGRLHGLGFLHGDLNPRNLLLAEGGTRTWVLDLDRGRIEPSLSDRARRDNLRRLYRAVRRREARGRRFLWRPDYLRFLRTYERVLGRPGWKADWRTIVTRDRRRGPVHRLGWFLEELLGGGPETRDGRAVVRPGVETGSQLPP